MLKRKKSMQMYEYDREVQQPVLKCSICNGEQVAGFKDLRTGKFEEVMLIRNQSDLQEFMERCMVSTLPKVY